MKELNSRVAIALAGVRDPSEEGKITGEFLGEQLGGMGYNFVSGLARGCDTAAL